MRALPLEADAMVLRGVDLLVVVVSGLDLKILWVKNKKVGR